MSSLNGRLKKAADADEVLAVLEPTLCFQALAGMLYKTGALTDDQLCEVLDRKDAALAECRKILLSQFGQDLVDERVAKVMERLAQEWPWGGEAPSE